MKNSGGLEFSAKIQTVYILIELDALITNPQKMELADFFQGLQLNLKIEKYRSLKCRNP